MPLGFSFGIGFGFAFALGCGSVLTGLGAAVGAVLWRSLLLLPLLLKLLADVLGLAEVVVAVGEVVLVEVLVEEVEVSKKFICRKF